MSALFYLYSSEGCHLCEEAQSIIANIIPEHQIKIIDIIDDEVAGKDLTQLYGVHIPVLERLSDNTLLFWPFNESQVVELT